MCQRRIEKLHVFMSPESLKYFQDSNALIALVLLMILELQLNGAFLPVSHHTDKHFKEVFVSFCLTLVFTDYRDIRCQKVSVGMYTEVCAPFIRRHMHSAYV